MAASNNLSNMEEMPQNCSKLDGTTENLEVMDEGQQPFTEEEEKLEKEHLKKVINAFLFYKYVSYLLIKLN